MALLGGTAAFSQDLSLQLENYPVEIFKNRGFTVKFKYPVNWETTPRTSDLQIRVMQQATNLQIGWVGAEQAQPIYLTVTEQTPKGTRTHTLTLQIKPASAFVEGESRLTVRFTSDEELKTEISKGTPVVSAPPQPRPQPGGNSAANPIQPAPAPPAATNAEDAYTKAEKLFAEGKYLEAQQLYIQASRDKPNDERILERLSQTSTLIAEDAKRKKQEVQNARERENAFKQEKETAERYEAEGKLQLAVIYYRRASTHLPNDAATKSKIESLNKKILEEEELSKKIEEFKSYAERAYTNGNLDDAVNFYQKAIQLKPNRALEDRLVAIATEKKKREEEERERQRRLAEDRVSREFNDYMTQADAAIAARDFKRAEDMVAEAARRRYNDPRVDNKLAEINRARDQYEKNLQLLEKQKAEAAMNQEYQNLLARADQYLKQKEYEKAREQVYLAMDKKPTDPAGQRKLEEIDRSRQRDAELELQSAMAKVNRQYQQLMQQANTLMATNKLDDAEKLLEEARNLKPGDAAANQQLEKLQERRIALAAELAKKQEARRVDSLNRLYAALLASADKAMTAGNLDKAEADYGQALMIKPLELRPQQQLQTIEKKRADLIAKQEADLKRQEEERLRNEAFAAAVARGDEALAAGNYEGALNAYAEARTLKPSDAAIKVKEATTKKAWDDALEAARLAKLKADEEKYNTLISEANSAMLANELERSKKLYAEAFDVFPQAGQYPIKQIGYVNKQIAIRDSLQRMADNAARYKQLIKAGDSAIIEKNLDLARQLFAEAVPLQPEETYAQNMVAGLDDPRERVRLEKKGDLVRFDRFVDAAIPLTNQGKYAEAIDLLDKALAIKPQDFRAQYERNRALTLKGGGTPPAPAQSTANANATSKPAVETPVPDTPPVQPAAQLMEVQKNTNITAIPLPSSTSSNPHEQVNTKNGMAGTKADTDPDKGPAANQPNATLTGQRVAATEEAVTPAPLSPMAMEQQSLAIPYDSVQMAQRFDGINLLNQPSGQRFTTDYYRPADTLNNYKTCQQLLPVPANTFIVDTVEADRIGATLSLVHFGAQNAFFRIDIRNHGATEYVAGEVSMHFEKADGTIVPYAPCYITGFPIVLPNHQYSLMLAARIGAPADEDKFVITLNERLKKTKLNFTIRAELYNKLLDNGNLP